MAYIVILVLLAAVLAFAYDPETKKFNFKHAGIGIVALAGIVWAWVSDSIHYLVTVLGGQ